jgi:DNA-binding XRE family transcriptional regulator
MSRHGLTSADVESMAQVSRQTVHNWKTGKLRPSLTHVASMIGSLSRRGIETTISDYLTKKRG